MTVLCDNCSPRNQCTADKNREKCKYFQPMTNEEWIRQASTEELIDFFEKITDPHVGYLVGYWQEWLKQPHHNEVEK